MRNVDICRTRKQLRGARMLQPVWGTEQSMKSWLMRAGYPRQRLVVGPGIVLVSVMGSQPALTTPGQWVLP